jgi:hypothetical protein
MQGLIGFILITLICGAIGFAVMDSVAGGFWGLLGALVGALGGIYLKIEIGKQSKR